MKIIEASEFDAYWKNLDREKTDGEPYAAAAVTAIIEAVRAEGDRAVRRFASRFDRSSPEVLEVAPETARAAWEELKSTEGDLAAALELAADHLGRFSIRQRAQFGDFEFEMEAGLYTGQRVIPVNRAAVYVPAGRFPLISTVLMGLIPAFAAGVGEVILASPPLEDGLPDRRIMAAAYLARIKGGALDGGGEPDFAVPAGTASLRLFAIGGAQAIAALALGTETVPKADLIVGPGNKYVAAAKRLLFGEVGIDFIAGPTDVLIIAGGGTEEADLAAADLLAQAEHDGDARARALVPGKKTAERIAAALAERLERLSTAASARKSLDAGGLIVIYHTREEAIRIANTIAPEHLELQVADPENWIPALTNFGSLFIGTLAVEALGDYSAGINHTLPTSGSARFSGGLSVRTFLKTLTTLRCRRDRGYEEARLAAERIARAEGLAGHAESAASRGLAVCCASPIDRATSR